MFRDPIETLQSGLAESLLGHGKRDGAGWALVSPGAWERAASLLSVQAGLSSFVDIFSARSNERNGSVKLIAHLSNPFGTERFALQTTVPDDGGAVRTLVGVFPAAEWYEREMFADYGINFTKDSDVIFGADDDETGSIFEMPFETAGFTSPVMLSLKIDGLRVSSADAKAGFAHRGLEKIAESLSWHSALRLSGKLNCSSPGIAAVGSAVAIERLFNIDVSVRARWLRTALCESWRIHEHMLTAANCLKAAGLISQSSSLFCACHALARSIERAFDARGMGQAVVIGGMTRDLGKKEANELCASISVARTAVETAARVAERDPVFRMRTRGIGVLSQHAAEAWGVTGPCLRAAGSDRDARLATPDLMYSQCEWSVVKGTEGDSFDRLAVVLAEAIQSSQIVSQSIMLMEPGPIKARAEGAVLPARSETYGTKEGRAAHVGLVCGDASLSKGEISSIIEAASGELGFSLISDGRARPARFRVRSPSFAICQAAPMIVRSCMIEDLPIIIASLGASASETDR